jgi:hypothetical protein
VIRSAEPAVWHYVYQASLSWKAPMGRGLLIEAGIYPCQVGFEGFFSKDDWNYTRGWLAELSPYFQAGLMLSYAFTDSLSAQLHLLNGWSLIADDNRAKSVGTQLAWSQARGGMSFNTLIGPELPRDDTHWRFFGDLVGTLRATADLSLATELDAGWQQQPGGSTSTWQGAALFARYAFGSHLAVAVRGELFRDPAAVVAPVGQTVGEATLTLEVRPAAQLTFKAEGRWDGASVPVFEANTGLREHQTVVVLGAVAEL